MKLRKLFSVTLAVGLQVLPLTRVLVAATPATGSSFALIATWLAGAAALLGGADAVSGASSISISPATATTGVPFNGIVQYSGAHASSAKSWLLKTNWNGAQTGCNTAYEIAPGLWLTNATTYLARVGGTPTASGTYGFSMRISDTANCGNGNTDTRGTTLTISGGAAVAPSITTPPASQTVTAGGNASFSVVASGTAPLTYQWQQNGVNLAGATTSALALTGVTAGQAGSYTVAVSNSVGGVLSTAATLTVNAAPVAPSITTPPASQTVTAGGNASFTVVASGTAPLTYQWQQNGVNLAGATTSALALTGVTAGQAGSYTVAVSNSVGGVLSTAATLTVNAAPVAPSITTPPASQTVTAGGNASFSVVASGTAPLTYQWQQNGVNLAGATTSALALTGVTAGQAGSYTVAVSNSVGGVLSTAATLTVDPMPATDTTRPTVAMTSPASGVVVNPAMTILGVASDNIGVKTVWYSINGGAFNNATGSPNWAVWGTPGSVLLASGTNLVRAYSEDLAGNVSLTNTLSLVYSQSDALSLVISGAGRVTGATNGQPIQSGRMLTLKAVPASGNVFSNWIGTVDGTLTYFSSSPSLTVPMSPRLGITANFVPNPFTSVAGQFNGLFYETNGVKVGTSGFFSLKLSERGSYSATILTEARRTSVSGQFSVGGRATNSVARSGTNALGVIWTLDLAGLEQISGTIGDGNWTAELTGDRSVFNTRTNPCAYAGKYTFVLPGTPGATLTPEGNSFGTVSIASNGVATLKGKLADKTTITQTVPLSKHGEWPLYVPLSARKGALLAWINFIDRPSDDFSGLGVWMMPPQAKAAYYPSGFTDVQSLVGSRYTPPVGVNGRVLELTNAIALLSGGDLPGAYTNGVVFGPGSQITKAYPNELTAEFTPASGVFRGAFKPGSDNGTVAFNGVVLQKSTNAFGCFFGKSQSGRVVLQGGKLPRSGGSGGDSGGD